MRSNSPILAVTPSETTSLELNHSRIIRRAIQRNVCREDMKFQNFSRQQGGETIPCGTSLRMPDLDEIEGKWPFDDDDEDDS